MARSSYTASNTWHGITRPGPGALLISELFGPTLQGEGPHSGTTATFLRLGACNLRCEWCDTAYTWNSERFDLRDELSVVPTLEVLRDIIARGADTVVLTGGEPALQADQLAPLALKLREAGHSVHVETSGTVALGPLLPAADIVVVSPKLRHSGMSSRVRLRLNVLLTLAAAEQTVFKFVARDLSDLDEIDLIVAALDLAPGRVWVMPEGTTEVAVLEGMRLLAEPVAARGWSLSGRLQILLWGDVRGR